jgi:hypothetical protein
MHGVQSLAQESTPHDPCVFTTCVLFVFYLFIPLARICILHGVDGDISHSPPWFADCGPPGASLAHVWYMIVAEAFFSAADW